MKPTANWQMMAALGVIIVLGQGERVVVKTCFDQSILSWVPRLHV
jgi:hypothetical protein